MSAPARNGWLPAWPGHLRRAGVLGMNARNTQLLVALNPRRLYDLVNDKIQTKELCLREAIPTPRTYAILDHPAQVPAAAEIMRQAGQFVVKPSRGSGGRGVLVIAGSEEGDFRTSSGVAMSWDEMRYHLLMTLAGAFSIGGRADRVIIEQRVSRHAAFEGLAVNGTPDVRLIVYRGSAIMGMLRLPTLASGGRANLHQGALGLGLDIATGVSTGGFCRDRSVEVHPDTGAALTGVAVPRWKEMLAVSEKLSAAVGLGYLGVDIVLGEEGPLVLEANGRPGLSIQIANRCGLMTRIAEAENRMTNDETRMINQ
ncbi:MAG: sugar-transfer associated ATP-grasp domain-containing protein [Phycisphaerae bacterium]